MIDVAATQPAPLTSGRFLFGGNAVFTVTSPSGERYTYRIAQPKKKEGDTRPRPFFASYLTGPRNTEDYTYLGILLVEQEGSAVTVRIQMTKASRLPADAKPIRVLSWVATHMLNERPLPDGYAVFHEGRCGRCGRPLTTPESVTTGFGPTCSEILGYDWGSFLRVARGEGTLMDVAPQGDAGVQVPEEAKARSTGQTAPASETAPARPRNTYEPSVTPSGGKVMQARFPGADMITGERFDAGADIYFVRGWPDKFHNWISLVKNTPPGKLPKAPEQPAPVATAEVKQEARTTKLFDPTALPLARPLFPFQVEGVMRVVQQVMETAPRSALLADDMGLGKTIQSIAATLAVGCPIFVICPANVRVNWVKEVILNSRTLRFKVVGTFLAKKAMREFLATLGAGPEREASSLSDADVIVCSYEKTSQFVIDNPDAATNKFYTMKKVVADEHKALIGSRFVVADEAHYAKSRQAKRSQAVYALFREAKYKLAMTGTPVGNRPDELWPILQMLNRSGDIGVKKRSIYIERFMMRGGTGFMELGGIMAQQPWYIRRLKEQVLKDLPAKMRFEQHIEMPDEARTAYDDLAKQVANRDYEREEAIVLLTELQTLANAGKVEAVADMLEERHTTGAWTMVQCSRVAPLRAVAAKLADAGIPYVMLTGDESNADRARNIAAFDAGEAKVCLTTVDTGINLTKADTGIFIDLDYSPLKVCQREDRIYRIGSQQHQQGISIIRVVAASIDVAKVRVLDRKMAMLHAVVDNNGALISSDPDFDNKLQRTIVDDIAELMGIRIVSKRERTNPPRHKRNVPKRRRPGKLARRGRR